MVDSAITLCTIFLIQLLCLIDLYGSYEHCGQSEISGRAFELHFLNLDMVFGIMLGVLVCHPHERHLYEN